MRKWIVTSTVVEEIDRRSDRQEWTFGGNKTNADPIIEYIENKSGEIEDFGCIEINTLGD